MKRFYAMTASAERVMKAETFPDDCLELVLDVRVMQSFLLGEDQRAVSLRNASSSYPVPMEEKEALRKECVSICCKTIL